MRPTFFRSLTPVALLLALMTGPAGAAIPEGGPGEPEALLPVAESAPETGLTLAQTVRIALERNLNLRAQTYDLLAGEAAVRSAYGLYDPVLGLSLARGVNKERLNLQFFESDSTVEYREYNGSLAQLVPTGAELALNFDNRRQSSEPPAGINPYYESELRFSLVQPLLRDFGATVTEQSILFAVKDRQLAVQDLREQAFSVLGQVRDAYFEVLRTRDNLAYRETSLELARKVLEENRARVDAGVLPPIEILEAEVGYKLREREVLDARRLYEDALDDLGLLLSSPRPVKVADRELTAPPVATDLELGFAAAMLGRPDVQRRLRTIERLNLEQEIAENQQLPQLDLSASYSHKGLGRDLGDDLDDVTSDRYPNWQLALTVSYPLGNREARNEVLRNKVRLNGLQARLAQLRDEVRNEIRAAMRLVEVNTKKIEVTGRARELAEEKLRTLLKRKEVGLATTRDVLEGEEDLAQARTEEISALADYNKAVTTYLQVTGELLRHERVYFVGELDPTADGPLLQMRME